MYEDLYERLPDAEAYLERIGLERGDISTDTQGLDRLIHAQLTHIPFDDMDVWGRGDCPSLSVKALFEKIILRRRGGYCFELNSLFHALLRELGFDAYLVAAHVMAGREEIYPPSHCAIVCTLDGEKFFCDVGYGGPVPDGALSFCGESRFGFRLEREGLYMKLINEKSGLCKICFKDVPVANVELLPMNYYISQKPDSPFRNILHLNLRLENGSVSIVDHEFKLRRGDERVENYVNLNDLPALLEEYFGIPADTVPLREIGPLV